MSEFKLGDYFLNMIVCGDIEQIAKIENDKYYFKTVKCVSGFFLDEGIASSAFSLQEIKNRCEKGVWKKLSNLQVKVLTGKINEGEK